MKILSEKLLKKYDRKEALHIMTGRQSDMIEPSRPADYAEAKLKTAVKCLMYFSFFFFFFWLMMVEV